MIILALELEGRNRYARFAGIRPLARRCPIITCEIMALSVGTQRRTPGSRPSDKPLGGYVSDIPSGWTDNMNVDVPTDRTIDEVVDFVIHAALSRVPDAQIESDLRTTFGFSPEDAALARDRVFGGIVRAATRNPANRPSRKKDPLAWESFGRAMSDAAIVASLYPQFVLPARKPWWRRWFKGNL